MHDPILTTIRANEAEFDAHFDLHQPDCMTEPKHHNASCFHLRARQCIRRGHIRTALAALDRAEEIARNVLKPDHPGYYADIVEAINKLKGALINDLPHA